jgi:hypothetical protein
MLIKIGAALAAIPAALLAGVAATGVAVVDVRDGGPGGHHIVVPVPLVAAQVAAGFVPREARKVDVGEARRYLPVANEVLKALAESPDGELVRVDRPNEHVRIAKVGRDLAIEVENAEGEVSVDVPIGLATAVLKELENGEASPASLVGALQRARLTTIADVRQGDKHVRVTVW